MVDCFSSVYETGLDVVVDALSLSLDIGDDLVLLLNEHAHLLVSLVFADRATHLVEHLGELSQSPLNLLDVGMSLLDLAVRSTGGAVAVRVEELQVSVQFEEDSRTYSLGEHLRVIRLKDLVDLLLSGIGLDWGR